MITIRQGESVLPVIFTYGAWLKVKLNADGDNPDFNVDFNIYELKTNGRIIKTIELNLLSNDLINVGLDLGFYYVEVIGKYRTWCEILHII